ncbi:class II aldolase/adducin family protein, partial [Aphanothece microscopica]|uniref:class II aldolase/adducin family protein n=1 Tax=Aphanothece microscopica TaxID=1049561 RepID=UPI003CE495DC
MAKYQHRLAAPRKASRCLTPPATRRIVPPLSPRATRMNMMTGAARLPGCSAEEWEARCDLAALYRLLSHFRMTDIIYTHLTARVPGSHDHFLINHYGVLFHEMRASDLVKVDCDGRIVEEAE